MTRRGFWSGRQHHLDRMTLSELVGVFYRYPAIVVYHVLLAACVLGFFLAGGTSPAAAAAAIAAASVNFSLSWYLIHRFLLQSRLLYRFRLTAALWKRIHYDHHRDPNDLRVLFGALPTTLPPMLVFALAAGVLASSLPFALAWLATLLAHTIWNEFCHCIQHLKVEPRLPYLRRIKKLHLLHHFKNENVYFGITNYFWDRVFGTYPDPQQVVASPTVFNLGYTGETERAYPWVRGLDRGATSA